MAFHPYIFFSSNCAEAFTRYGEVFGATPTIMTMADFPEDQRMPGAPLDAVMHAALRVGDGLLMGSDDPSGDGGPKVGFAVSWSAPDEATARDAFDAIAEGGEVTMSMAPVPWSPAFGMATDRFGVPWMIDVTPT